MVRTTLLLLPLLSCTSKIDEANFKAREGEPCEEIDGCRTGLVCAHDGICQQEGTPGAFLEDDDCLLTDECALGLVCDADGACASPGDAGTGGEGETCEDNGDCQMGFACQDGVCVDLAIPYWAGETCLPETDGDFKVWFEVPEQPPIASDVFYRLPFPNDGRLVDGHPDLSGHPSPGALSPSVDLWLAAAEQAEGYPLNPVVILRTNHRLEPSSVSAFGDRPDTLFFADITPSSDNYGPRSSFVYLATTARDRYACGNQVTVSTWPGVPLDPDTTYAVWLSTGITSAQGESPVPSDDFLAVLSRSRPGDDGDYRLVPTWDAYEPFRDYLDAQGIDAATIAGAAVFTTGDPAGAMRSVGYAVGQANVDPTPRALTLCGDGAASPCADIAACGAAEPGFAELHALLDMPSFQGGDTPFATEGGGWVWSLDNTPAYRGREEACLAMSVPEGEPPAAGWPVVLYVPGQGEDFRAFVSQGFAAAMAQAPHPDGGTLGAVVISADLPTHGHRGAAPELFFNLDNPDASLGNRLQVGADLHQVVALVEGWSLSAEESPTGVAIPLNADRISLVGRGAGVEAATGFLAWTRDVDAAVLAGAGGLTALSLTTQQEPEVMPYALRRMFADTALDRLHPMVGVMQMSLERSDAVVYGRMLLKDPEVGGDPKHLLQLYGLDDPVAPDAVQQALQSVMGLPTVGEVAVDFEQYTTSAPASENLLSEFGGRYTGGSLQLDGGYDALLGAEGQAAAVRFLGAAAAGEAPSIE
ncbi:MAG: hypothetical protein H6739_38745 [Alphaproteobacteria bacterium]|nr:hypothetical protein [Alphaproteobacteria bacterium]